MLQQGDEYLEKKLGFDEVGDDFIVDDAEEEGGIPNDDDFIDGKYDDDDDAFIEGTYSDTSKVQENTARLSHIFGDMRHFFAENSALAEEFKITDQDYESEEKDTEMLDIASEESASENEEAVIDSRRQKWKNMTKAQKTACILKSDLPQRYFDREMNAVPVPESEQEAKLEEEAKWIWQNAFYPIRKDEDDSNRDEGLIPIIQTVLGYIRLEHLEVPYIEVYKREYWSSRNPALSLTSDDLWTIYEWDGRWVDSGYRRLKLQKLVQTHDAEDIDLLQYIEEASEEYELDDVQDYTHFLTHKARNLQVKKGAFKRRQNRGIRILKIETEFGLSHFVKSVGLSARQFGENLRVNYQKHEPHNTGFNLEEKAKEYVKGRLMNVDRVLRAVRMVAAFKIGHDVFVRKAVRQIYWKNAVISTRPTIKGAREMSWTHQYYGVRRLGQKPLSKFTDAQYCLIKLAEKEGFIECKMSIAQKKVKENDNPEKADPLFFELSELYRNEAFTPEDKKIDDQRRLILKEAIDSYLCPMSRNWAKKELLLKAQNVIIAESISKMRSILVKQPPAPPDDSNRFRIVACVTGDIEESTVMVVLNEYGDVLDHLSLDWMKARVTWRSAGAGVSETMARKEEDIKRFQAWITPHKPFLVVIDACGADSPSFKRTMKERGLTDCPTVLCHYGSPLTGQIFAVSERGEREFKKYSNGLREAIGLGRFIIDPISEIASLWYLDDESRLNNLTNNREILSYPFHPLMTEVPPNLMLDAMEKCFIRVINHVGLDLNAIVSRPFLCSTMQFVCGLGQLKGKQLLDHVKRRGYQPSREELRAEPCVLGPQVFRNAAGFLIIRRSYAMDDSHPKHNFFDETRIHPESYGLAQSVVISALDVETESDDDEGDEYESKRHDKMCTYVERLLKIDNLEKLDQLDLDRFAAAEEEDGRGKQLDTLNLIKDEFKCPYSDRSETMIPYSEISLNEQYDLHTGESEATLQVGAKITAEVVSITIHAIICRMHTGLKCQIRLEQCSDNKPFDSGTNDESQIIYWLKERFYMKMSLIARVIEINKEDMPPRIYMTTKTSELTEEKDLDYERRAEILRPRDPYFVRDLEDDRRLTEIKEEEAPSFIPRSIVHPLFANCSREDACEMLESKNQGDIIVRPSSKGIHSLTITWKVHEDTYFHIEVKEEAKPIGNILAIGHVLRIGKDKFEDLDEIIARFVEPMVEYSGALINHKTFRFGEASEIEQMLKSEKAQNPSRIPYFLSFSEKPGIFNFSYLPNKTIKVERIVVTAEGYSCGEYTETQPNKLISRLKKVILERNKAEMQNRQRKAVKKREMDKLQRNAEMDMRKKELVKAQRDDGFPGHGTSMQNSPFPQSSSNARHPPPRSPQHMQQRRGRGHFRGRNGRGHFRGRGGRGNFGRGGRNHFGGRGRYRNFRGRPGRGHFRGRPGREPSGRGDR